MVRGDLPPHTETLEKEKVQTEATNFCLGSASVAHGAVYMAYCMSNEGLYVGPEGGYAHRLSRSRTNCSVSRVHVLASKSMGALEGMQNPLRTSWLVTRASSFWTKALQCVAFGRQVGRQSSLQVPGSAQRFDD